MRRQAYKARVERLGASARAFDGTRCLAVSLGRRARSSGCTQQASSFPQPASLNSPDVLFCGNVLHGVSRTGASICVCIIGCVCTGPEGLLLLPRIAICAVIVAILPAALLLTDILE